MEGRGLWDDGAEDGQAVGGERDVRAVELDGEQDAGELAAGLALVSQIRPLEAVQARFPRRPALFLRVAEKSGVQRSSPKTSTARRPSLSSRAGTKISRGPPSPRWRASRRVRRMPARSFMQPLVERLIPDRWSLSRTRVAS